MSQANTTGKPTDPPDPDEVAGFAFRVWSYKQREMVSLLARLPKRYANAEASRLEMAHWHGAFEPARWARDIAALGRRGG